MQTALHLFFCSIKAVEIASVAQLQYLVKRIIFDFFFYLLFEFYHLNKSIKNHNLYTFYQNNNAY